MSGAELSCEVWVDGARLADTGNEFLASAPTAMDELSITWGRGSIVDQPDTSSCTFTVADRGGDTDWLGLLHVGRPLEVWAGGQLGTGVDTDVAVDGGFETTPVTSRVRVLGGTAAAGGTPYEGAQAIMVTPTLDTAVMAIPPAPFSVDFSAWDTVPMPSPGETWTVSLAATPAVSQTVTLTAALFTDPSSVGTADPVGDPVTLPPGDPTGYTVLEVVWTVPHDVARGWVGVIVTVAAGAWRDEPGTWDDRTATWDDYTVATIDALHVLAAGTAERRVLVFTGRITDLDAHANNNGVAVDVTAADWTADLANDYIGDNPWLVQTIAARVARIRTLSRLDPEVDIDPIPAALSVTWVDVDSQPVLGLLTELATTADAVLWSAAHSTRGFYLWMEDPSRRQSFATLTYDTGTDLVEVTGDDRAGSGVVVSACNLARDDVSWAQDVADVVNIVDLSWLEQLTDDTGAPAPTERTITVETTDAIAEFGVRRAGYSTQLVSESDGLDVADRILNRSTELGWHASGLTWDTTTPADWSDGDRITALDLLDGTRRIALPMTITELPAWSPSGESLLTYLEGGSYTYTGGRWMFDLTVTPSGMAGYSVAWADLDAAWSWNEFDPAIDWQDLWGVAALAGAPRWKQLDQHAWSADPNTWNDYNAPQTGGQ